VNFWDRFKVAAELPGDDALRDASQPQAEVLTSLRVTARHPPPSGGIYGIGPSAGGPPRTFPLAFCNDCGVEQRISLVTLGVSDLARARASYEALGWSDAQQPDDELCFFQAGGMVFGLWTALGGHGAPGIELAHNVRSPEEVTEVLNEAARAGGSIVRAAGVADWGGTPGAFADPDGYVWEVAHNAGWTLDPDGAVHI
jgi:uncharacterized protein